VLLNRENNLLQVLKYKILRDQVVVKSVQAQHHYQESKGSLVTQDNEHL
jgi:hypothetical protein